MAIGVPVYPASIDDHGTLLPLGTDGVTYLLQDIGPDDVVLRVGNSTRLRPSGMIEIEAEQITYTNIIGDTLYVDQRGYGQVDGGYPPSAHKNGVEVHQRMTPSHHRVLSDAIIAVENTLTNLKLSGLFDTDWLDDDLVTGNSIFWNNTTNRWIAYTPYFGDEANTGALWSATVGQVPRSDGAGNWTPVTPSMPGHTHTASNITDFTEAAQDVVGAFFADSTSLDVTYNDAGNALTAAVIYGGSSGDYGTANTAARSDHTHGALVPTGSIMAWALAAAPTGWALCDGATVLRSSTLGALLVTDGMKYGTGNGSTTVNLPNIKGRVIVGLDTGDTDWDVLGETRGVKTVTLTSAESGLPQHLHAVSITTGGHSVTHTHTEDTANRSGSVLQGGGSRNDINPLSQNSGAASTSHTHLVSGNTANVTAVGASSAHTNLQPSIVMNYIIKL